MAGGQQEAGRTAHCHRQGSLEAFNNVAYGNVHDFFFYVREEQQNIWSIYVSNLF